MTARVEHTTTSGVFALDGGNWNVDNNVWLIGDDRECVVIDTPHDADAIAALVGPRRLLAILCTHAHNDHVNAAAALSARYAAPVRLHPDDDVLWRMSYPDFDYQALTDLEVITVAGIELQTLHTPGHSPGAVCYYAPEVSGLFSGDTLFQGGPGATGRSHSSFGTIIVSLRDIVLPLPPETRVYTGHGPTTTIGAEHGFLDDWVARGY